MKKCGLILALALATTAGSSVTALAETSTVPVKLNKKATQYNVTISEALNLDFQGNFTVSSNIDVTNNSAVGVIHVTEIAKVSGKDGWTAKPVATDDYWKNLQLNSKQFGLRYDGDIAADLAEGAATGTPLKAVNPTVTEQLGFTGYVGGTTVAVTAANIADVVITLGYNTAVPTG